MGGGPDINYPAQPSYGEGMADALKAQVELLTGTGDFASTGSLESLLPLEESIRRKTAQTDTDILRQTLLGSEQEVVRDPKTGKYGIPGAEPIQREGGEPAGARYQMLPFSTGRGIPAGTNANGNTQYINYGILDSETGGITGMYDLLLRDGYIEEFNGNPNEHLYTQKAVDDGLELPTAESMRGKYPFHTTSLMDILYKEINTYNNFDPSVKAGSQLKLI